MAASEAPPTPVPAYALQTWDVDEVRSLCFVHDRLLDLCVGRSFDHEGTVGELPGTYEQDFARVSPSGRYAVLGTRFGEATGDLYEVQQDLSLRHMKSLSRDNYRHEIYEQPAELIEHDDRVFLAYCPESYNILEFKELVDGRVVEPPDAVIEPGDYFFSRLMTSPKREKLLSAGWVWGSMDRAIFGPISSMVGIGKADCSLFQDKCYSETSSACWLTDDVVVFGTGAEAEEDDYEADDTSVTDRGIYLFDITQDRTTFAISMPEHPGPIMAVGQNHILSLSGWPKLWSLSSRQKVAEWPELAADVRVAGHGGAVRTCPFVLDPAQGRFALVSLDRSKVTLVSFDLGHTLTKAAR